MSVEIMNLCVNVKIVQSEQKNESLKSLKEEILRECHQLIERQITQDRER